MRAREMEIETLVSHCGPLFSFVYNNPVTLTECYLVLMAKVSNLYK